MSMFQKSVVNKYLKMLDDEKINQAFDRFTKFYGNKLRLFNILHLKEENYQEGFLREIFVNVLGYTINPDINFNLTTEYKNQTDNKKADGAILKDGQAIGVIELKSTKTHFIESITNQAFNYKHNQPNCKYVITSNFHHLRFFIDNSVEYEEFDLFELTINDFKRLYLFLSKDSIFNEIPLKLKEETKFHEENISDKFYKDYKNFKDTLFENLLKNNPQYDKLTLFKKSQKLLDRFLFIWFAEDCGLCPPNSVSKIIDQWKMFLDNDEYYTLYSRFQKMFTYLNEGKKLKAFEFPAYNGGLFRPDEVIDNIELKIDDNILLDKCLKLSAYDFNTDIDVNILGHIFEHSLSELEEIANEINGETNGNGKLKTKRKKDGIFYTPKYITQFIVENTIGELCKRKKTELTINEIDINETFRKNEKITKQGKVLFETLKLYKKWLFDLKILDPACGSGAFLNQALDFLIAEHKQIDDLISHLTGEKIRLFDTDKSILEQNIFGVDINEESVEIAKLSLWLRTAKKDRKLSELNDNIKCGNSLINDKNIDNLYAFNWHESFPEIMQNGGFDVIIGNPPYVFAREKITDLYKEFYSTNYQTAQYQSNLYILFIEKSIQLLKPFGYLGFIVPNAWLMVNSAEKLREHLLKNTRVFQIVNFLGETFLQASVEPVILNLCKEKSTNYLIDIYNNLEDEFQIAHQINSNEFAKNSAYEFTVFLDEKSKIIIDKIKEKSTELENIALIKAGLKAYQTGKGKPKQNNYIVQTRPFDFKFQKDENTHKYLEGKDVQRYGINWSENWLQFGEHLAEPRIFHGKKIIIREIAAKYPNSIIAVYTEDLYLFNMSNIAVLEKPESNYSLKYIIALLNSKLMSFYFLKNTAKSVRDLFPKIILSDLRKFPIKEVSYEEQLPFIEKVNTILISKQELINLTNEFSDYLKAKYNLTNLTENLKSWYELNSSNLLKEFEKLKIKLEPKDEISLLNYFKEQKKITDRLLNTISTIDAEIDNSVYLLYGLNEAEITIVEKRTK